MVHKAEQYKAEGEVRRDRVAAKNFLEVHVFRVKSSSQEDSRREKIPEEDRCEEQDKCQEVLAWLEHSQLTGKEGVCASEEGTEQTCCPIFCRFYAGPDVPRGSSSEAQVCQERPGTGPLIGELD